MQKTTAKFIALKKILYRFSLSDLPLEPSPLFIYLYKSGKRRNVDCGYGNKFIERWLNINNSDEKIVRSFPSHIHRDNISTSCFFTLQKKVEKYQFPLCIDTFCRRFVALLFSFDSISTIRMIYVLRKRGYWLNDIKRRLLRRFSLKNVFLCMNCKWI